MGFDWKKFIIIFLLVSSVSAALVIGIIDTVQTSSNEYELEEDDGSRGNDLTSQIAAYKGMQKGVKIRRLVGILEQNAKKTTDPTMLPDIAYQAAGGDDFKIVKSTSAEPNYEEIGAIASKFDANYSYTVEFTYTKKREIKGVIIKYNADEKFKFEADET